MYNHTYVAATSFYIGCGLTITGENTMNGSETTDTRAAEGGGSSSGQNIAQVTETAGVAENTISSSSVKERKLMVAVAVCTILLIGGMGLFVAIRGDGADDDGGDGMSQEEIDIIKNAAEELRVRAERLQGAVGRLDGLVAEAGGWMDLNLNDNPELQGAMRDLISSVDSLGEAIVDGGDDLLKQFWKQFGEEFDARRGHIVGAIDREADALWLMMARELYAMALRSSEQSVAAIGHEERDKARKADVARVVYELEHFMRLNSGFLPGVGFSAQAGQPAPAHNSGFLDGFLGRNEGRFSDPHGVKYGFVTDRLRGGHAADVDTMVFSGMGFRCGVAGRFAEADTVAFGAVTVRLESGEFYCRDNSGYVR